MKTIKVKGLPTIEMVEVKGGIFHYGPTTGVDRFPSELGTDMPLNDFCIAKTQVTEELWDAVMGTGNNLSQLPKRNVTWNDCQTFIAKLNEKSEFKFRLAYEPEWEYAARGGNMSKGYLYSGSNDAEDVAIFSTVIPSKEVASKVASLESNELDTNDMSGNVWEWCENWFENGANSEQYYFYCKKFLKPLSDKLKDEKGGLVKLESELSNISPKDHAVDDPTGTRIKGAVSDDVKSLKEKVALVKIQIEWLEQLINKITLSKEWTGQQYYRVYRGGGYDTNKKCSRPYTSVPGMPDYTRPSLGFRLAMDAAPTSDTKPKDNPNVSTRPKENPNDGTRVKL